MEYFKTGHKQGQVERLHLFNLRDLRMLAYTEENYTVVFITDDTIFISKTHDIICCNNRMPLTGSLFIIAQKQGLFLSYELHCTFSKHSVWEEE